MRESKLQDFVEVVDPEKWTSTWLIESNSTCIPPYTLGTNGQQYVAFPIDGGCGHEPF